MENAGKKNMRDFNHVCYELYTKLRYTCQDTEGKIYWYDGVPELLLEMVGFLYADLEQKCGDANVSRRESDNNVAREGKLIPQ